MEYRIRFTKGNLAGQWFAIGADAIAIGRSHTNDVVLHTEDVSRRHLLLARQDSGIRLDNLSSRKTAVDGTPMEIAAHCFLVAGQTVLIGAANEFVLETVESQDDDATRPPPPADADATKNSIVPPFTIEADSPSTVDALQIRATPP